MSAGTTFTEKSLNWEATKGTDEMCESAWNFQKDNLKTVLGKS